MHPYVREPLYDWGQVSWYNKNNANLKSAQSGYYCLRLVRMTESLRDLFTKCGIPYTLLEALKTLTEEVNAEALTDAQLGIDSLSAS